MWAIIITFMMWSMLPPLSPKVIVPWILAAICFVGWRVAVRKTHKADLDDAPRKRIRRYR